MARALADIEQDILALSDRERVELIRKLIGDLDAPGDANSDGDWLNESERRLGEIENGTARTFPADDVLKEARTLLSCNAPGESIPRRARNFCMLWAFMKPKYPAWDRASSPRDRALPESVAWRLANWTPLRPTTEEIYRRRQVPLLNCVRGTW